MALQDMTAEARPLCTIEDIILTQEVTFQACAAVLGFQCSRARIGPFRDRSNGQSILAEAALEQHGRYVHTGNFCFYQRL